MQTVARFNIWVTPKTIRPSFCQINIKTFSCCMHWMVFSVHYLGCMVVVVNKNALFAEWSITERDCFQILLLGILSWNPLYIFRYRCCDGHFPGFGKYIFPELQTCTALVLSAEFTEGSCSSNRLIFNNFLLTFLFLISNNNFLFPIATLLIFDIVLHYQLNVFKISKTVYYNHRSIGLIQNDEFGQRWIANLPSSHLSYFPELFILQV